MITTGEQLVTKVLARCYWPSDGTAPLTSEEILAIADEEISGEILPSVILSHGDYYTAPQDYAITANRRRYRLPANSYGPIREVVYVDADGIETDLPLMDLGDLGRDEVWRNRARFRHFIDGDFIGLDPMPDTTEGTLRVRYYRHPNKLMLAAETWQVLDFGEITLPGPVTAYALQVTLLGTAELASDDVFDIISAGNAHQYLFGSTVLTAQAAVAGEQTVLLVVADGPALLASSIAAGDYVAPVGYSPIVQLPDSMIPVLVRRVASGCLRANSDHVAADKEEAAANRLMEKAISLMQPRTESGPAAVGCRNAPLRVMGG